MNYLSSLDEANVTGLMVLHDGGIRYEYYDEGVTPDSRHHIWSATKSYTSTLIAIALHEGRIDDLDDPVEKYAAQYQGTAYGETPLRHVLMMSSGVDFFHHKGEPDRNDMYRDLVQRGEDLDVWAGRLQRRVPSGTDFNYLATDTHVLSVVLRNVYGKPVTEILQEKLWEPAGFAGSAIWSQHQPGDAGNTFGHCCLAVRLQEFAHLGQLYLDELIIGGRQVVAPAWLEMVARPQAVFQEPGIDPETGSFRMGYSLQFWLPEGYDDEYVALGAFGQYLWIDHKRKFVVAHFSSGHPINRSGEDGADLRHMASVMRALGSAVTRSDSIFTADATALGN